MTITLELPPDVEAGLLVQAQTHGLSLETYLLTQVLREAVEKPRRKQDRKSLARLFSESPLKGLDIEFERNQDSGRPVSFETLLVEGLATGGSDIPLTREFWKELKAEALDLAKKHRGRKKGS